jgi:hypothetical protein
VPYDEHTPEGFDSVITMGLGHGLHGEVREAEGEGKNKGDDLLAGDRTHNLR